MSDVQSYLQPHFGQCIGLFSAFNDSAEKARAICFELVEASVCAPFRLNKWLKALLRGRGDLSETNMCLQSEQMHWYLVFGIFNSSIITANSVTL